MRGKIEKDNGSVCKPILLLTNTTIRCPEMKYCSTKIFNAFFSFFIMIKQNKSHTQRRYSFVAVSIDPQILLISCDYPTTLIAPKHSDP
jgi:hypothetical protein